MLPEIENRVQFLNQVLIFNELEEDELVEVAEHLKEDFAEAGEIIFSEGDTRDNLYIVLGGTVNVTRIADDGSDIWLADFDSGDSFGEAALYYKRKRSASITAVSDTELLYLDEDDFKWLLATYPQVEPYLIATTRTHEISRRLQLDWLDAEETISLIDRRHPISMIFEIIGVLFLVFLTLSITGFVAFFLRGIQVISVLFTIFAGIVSFLGLVASLWSYFEWRNDYFFVTNIRVVWRERILLRSASRQEVPLRTIQSLDVQTPNFVARAIRVGNLIVRTFNSQMILTDVNNPERMKTMINSFLSKARSKVHRAERAAIRRTVRNQLGLDAEQIEIEIPENIQLSTQKEKQRFGIFRTRIVDGEVITYRKHWLKFLGRAWQPTLALLAASLFSFWLTPSVLVNDWSFSLLGLAYVVTVVIFGWWIYQYADWRNDIYRLTRDRIIDREKKPLGKESFRSAPIKNIQSVGHQIPNTIGLIFNVGDVKINVGDETLTFDGVYRPALVHQDISRRMEEFAAEVERSRISQEHERMSTWLSIYHEESQIEETEGDIPDFF